MSTVNCLLGSPATASTFYTISFLLTVNWITAFETVPIIINVLIAFLPSETKTFSLECCILICFINVKNSTLTCIILLSELNSGLPVILLNLWWWRWTLICCSYVPCQRTVTLTFYLRIICFISYLQCSISLKLSRAFHCGTRKNRLKTDRLTDRQTDRQTNTAMPNAASYRQSCIILSLWQTDVITVSRVILCSYWLQSP